MSCGYLVVMGQQDQERILRVQERLVAARARQQYIGDIQRRSWEVQQQVIKLRKEVEAALCQLRQPNDLTWAEPENEDPICSTPERSALSS